MNPESSYSEEQSHGHPRTYRQEVACGGCQQPTCMRLLRRQPVVAAATAEEVANADQLSLVPDLDAPSVVNALRMAALAR
jgi:hypothetical protein